MAIFGSELILKMVTFIVTTHWNSNKNKCSFTQYYQFK